MTETDQPPAAAPPVLSAAEERAAILAIVERYLRLFSHGHGATGAQVLEQIIDEIQRRGD